MNRLHQSIFSSLDELSGADDKRIADGYATLVGRIEQAFHTEQEWMEKIDFPAMRLHQEEHARVLAGLHHVHYSVLNGDVAIARRVVEELLPQWLAFHIATMDTALAVAIEMSPLGSRQTVP